MTARTVLSFRPRPGRFPTHGNEPCTIVRQLDRAEITSPFAGLMFEVRLPERGETIHAFADELVIPALFPDRDRMDVNDAADRAMNAQAALRHVEH